jgi:hypothetical protein
MIEASIWGAFRAAGLEFDIGVEPYRFLFHEETLRSPGIPGSLVSAFPGG